MKRAPGIKPKVESTNKVITGYLNHHFNHFKINLESALDEFDDEAIHQYRVSIKRIRSVFNAINKMYPGDILPVELLVPLTAMFKAGGTVRDEQVQYTLLLGIEEKYGVSFPLIRQHYERRIGNSTEEFLIRSKFFDKSILEIFPVKVQEALEQFEDSDLQARLFNMIDHSMEKLRHRRPKATDPYKLHRFRGRFKQLSYLVEMVYYSSLEPNIDKQTYQKLKTFGQQLGDWHDIFQLWSKAGEFFRSTTDIHLLEESFELKKLLTPVHDAAYQEMQDKMKVEDLFIIPFVSNR
jgi:CHAD domain-containing protein